MTEAGAEAEDARFVARYDGALVRRAVRTFMWRRMFRTPWFAGGVLCSAALIGIGLAAPPWRPAAGAGVLLLLLLVGLAGLVWRAQLTASLGRLRSLSPPEAQVLLFPSRIVFRTNLAESAVPWSTFTEAWRLPGFWMLFSAPNSFNILPLDGVDPVIADRLAQRLPTTPRRSPPPRPA